MNLKSTVSIARSGTKSLRTTIPEGIVAFLDLKKGDMIEWSMENKGKKRLVIVRKEKIN